MPSPSLKAISFRLTASLTMLLLVTLGVDRGLQLCLPIPAVGSGEWAGTPRTSLHLVSKPDGFESTHRYNSLGFRGDSIAPQPKVGVSRVICIGDSWTEGIGAEESQTWPAVMGSVLPADFEVINLGDAGAGPDRYLEILTQVGVALAPQHCIMCVIPSDFYGGAKLPSDLAVRTQLRDDFRNRDSWLATAMAHALPGWVYLVDRSRGKWHPRNGIYWTAYEIPEPFLQQHIAKTYGVDLETAQKLLEDRKAQLEPECVSAARAQAYNGYRIDWELFNPHASFRCRVEDMNLAENELKSSIRQWVAEFSKICRRHQIEPSLCFFPEAGLVSRAPVGPMVDDYYQQAPDITADNSMSAMLGQVCDDLEVRYLDATPLLRGHRQEKLFLRYDGHPNVRAYEIVGTWLGQNFEGSDVSRQATAQQPQSTDRIR